MRIPARYFMGTAQHETNFATNEIDTEDSGYVSKGIFQLSDGEAVQVGSPTANLYDLDDAMRVLAKLQEGRLDQILRLAPTAAEPDLMAYLSIAHNQGLGLTDAEITPATSAHDRFKGALGTIRAHGCNWSAYTARNLDEAMAAVKAATDANSLVAAREKLAWWRGVVAYGCDVISGGERWPKDVP